MSFPPGNPINALGSCYRHPTDDRHGILDTAQDRSSSIFGIQPFHQRGRSLDTSH
ncbi:hypothetical protein CBFG_06124 [Clostridiales bacterium 1_7_47FAA]|nr:hypothetical protein CBFG_06124 [Clostridiales bacterium 1_7_47FAA]